MIGGGASSSVLLRLPRNGQQGHGAAEFGPGRRGRGEFEEEVVDNRRGGGEALFSEVPYLGTTLFSHCQ